MSGKVHVVCGECVFTSELLKLRFMFMKGCAPLAKAILLL